MTAIGTLPVVLGTGIHSARPAASAVGKGGLYSCTTHSLVYQTDGSSWTTWASLTGTGMTNPMTTKGDVILGDTSGTPTRLAAGTSTYVLTSNGAAAFPSWQAGGGGGGSDLVQTYSGGGSVYIPGLRGSADVLPTSPGASDDEFDTTSTFTTALGSLDTSNVTDAKSYLHQRKNATGGQALFGHYKTAPSFPFTVTAKLAEFLFGNVYQMAGIMLGVTSPGSFACFGVTNGQNGSGTALGVVNPEYSVWSSNTSRSSVSTYSGETPDHHYLRVIATSTSNIEFQHSTNGLIWKSLATGLNPGITITTVGLVVGSATNSVVGEAMWDWVRFT